MFKTNMVNSVSQKKTRYLHREQFCLSTSSLLDPLHAALILMKSSENGNKHFTSTCHAHWVAAMVWTWNVQAWGLEQCQWESETVWGQVSSSAIGRVETVRWDLEQCDWESRDCTKWGLEWCHWESGDCVRSGWKESLCHWGITYLSPISFPLFSFFWPPWGKQLSTLHFPSLCTCLAAGPQGQPFRNGGLQRHKPTETLQSWKADYSARKLVNTRAHRLPAVTHGNLTVTL